MTNMAAMNQRMDQWMSEKPSFDGNGPELRLYENDLVIGQLVSNGQDGDTFIKAFRSHVFPDINPKSGKRFNHYRYCAAQNGEGVECPFCAQGHSNIKERMSMWFYVTNFLHAQLPPARQGQPQVQYAPVQYEGRTYFNQEVMGFKRWDTSAWKDSPWGDIVRITNSYGGVPSAFTANLLCTGNGMQTRFKFWPIPNSPALDASLYQQATMECQPIITMLRAEMAQAVVLNPAMAAQPGQQMAQGVVAQPGSFVNAPVTIPFTPSGMPAPTLQAPTLQPVPLGAAPPVFTPAPAPIAPAVLTIPAVVTQATGAAVPVTPPAPVVVPAQLVAAPVAPAPAPQAVATFDPMAGGPANMAPGATAPAAGVAEPALQPAASTAPEAPTPPATDAGAARPMRRMW